mgnify:CR=1 FL=1
MSRIPLKIGVRKVVHPHLLFERDSCYGNKVNPPFSIGNIPVEGKSIALIMESSDQQGINRTHWIAWNIPATGLILENESRGDAGINDFGTQGYLGPSLINFPNSCTFRFFVLDRFLSFPKPSMVSKFDLYAHIINYGLGHGKYEFQNLPLKKLSAPLDTHRKALELK